MKSIVKNLLKFIKCFLTLSIIIIISFNLVARQKNIYYYCIDYLHINSISGLSVNEIKLNYDYIIEYLTNNKEETFDLPTLKSSPNGKYHFKEVKILFKNLNTILKVFLLAIFILVFMSDKDFSFIKSTFYYMMSLFLLLITLFLINFNYVFNIFHGIFFNNNYWLFDEKVDPVILILPERFFFICGIFILFFSITISALLNFVYSLINKKA